MDFWRIYYGDGEAFGHEDGTPWDAPRENVQIIAQQHPRVGFELVSSADYYYFEPETRFWYVADLWTVRDHLARAHHPLVLFGRMTTNEAFAEILQRANAELPQRKSGWLQGERRVRHGRQG